MAIPKLKVYRLSDNYSQLDDNDMQYLSDDEMLPISAKNLNPLTVQEMVGVRERRDAHMVVESDWKIVEFPMDVTKTSMGAIETLTKQCDNWVMGKGNFRVFVKKILLNDYQSSGGDSSDSSSSDNVVINNLFDECTMENNWYQIDRKFWDYEIDTVKKYYYLDENNKLTFTDQPTLFTIEQIHQVNEIKFKIGNMLIKSNVFFNEGYSQYMPLVSNSNAENRIIVMYKTFRQLNETDELLNDTIYTLDAIKQIKGNNSDYVTRSLISDFSKYRVPFGDVYNGNKQGRCFFNDDGKTSSSYDNTKIDNTKVHYYEGNYIYKKKVLPLRVLVAQSQECVSEFIADSVITDGSCIFNADYDWFVDGLMKPIVMQRITIYEEDGSEHKIFKPLQESLQYTLIFDSGQNNMNNIHYKLSLIKSYYEINKSYFAFPKQIFMFYNKVDDTLGNIFDFNYDYRKFINENGYSIINNWQPQKENVESYAYQPKFGAYGYANRGNLIANQKNVDFFSYDTNNKCQHVYKKCEILSVVSGYGYEGDKDLQLIENKDENNKIINVSFVMPTSFTENNVYYNEYYANELGYKIYINGKLIWNTIDQNFSSSSSSGEVKDYQVQLTNEQIIVEGQTYTFPKWIITKLNDEIDYPKDLMLVYYEKYKMKFSKEDTGYVNENNEIVYRNPLCIGYRIPCYEKVKNTNLFVSSFPNWLKGHLNNDLDVFVGNRSYSGTAVDVDNKNIEAIYPNYSNEGWYAMYPEGSVQFAQNQIQYDYFDVFNYGTQMNAVSVQDVEWNTIVQNVLPNYIDGNEDSINSSYKLYYNKVKYNVAYYDGIYAVIRSKLSNYSIQNGGSHYALLQDDDFKDSVGKRWVLRDDNYIRFLYESGLTELPEKIRVSNEQTSVLSDIEINDGEFLRVNTQQNRIVVVNFVPSYNNQFNNSMIVCLNTSNKITGKTSVLDLTNNDIRVHIKIDDYKLYIGLQHEEGCDIFNDNPCNCNKQIDITDNYNINFFTLPNIKWYCLEPLQDYYHEIDIDDVQLNAQDIGETVFNHEDKILKRYKYHNKDWAYDVYFEIFSYRYSQNKDSNGKFAVQSVEYIVYKLDK